MFIPKDSAQPNSRSIVETSKVSACHISNWLMAVLGMKLLPTSHGCLEYQWLARLANHGWPGAAARAASRETVKQKIKIANRIPRILLGEAFEFRAIPYHRGGVDRGWSAGTIASCWHRVCGTSINKRQTLQICFVRGFRNNQQRRMRIGIRITTEWNRKRGASICNRYLSLSFGFLRGLNRRYQQ